MRLPSYHPCIAGAMRAPIAPLRRGDNQVTLPPLQVLKQRENVRALSTYMMSEVQVLALAQQ
jgi:hypothetical protein